MAEAISVTAQETALEPWDDPAVRPQPLGAPLVREELQYEPDEAFIEHQANLATAVAKSLSNDSPYFHATPQTLFDELHALEVEIAAEGRLIKQLATDKANAAAKYEELKNNMLIDMVAEEHAGTVPKRTVDQRTALYRQTYQVQRLEKDLKAMEFEAANTYIKALLGNQISLECRVKLIKADMHDTRNQT
jgi:hypothetical protein